MSKRKIGSRRKVRRCNNHGSSFSSDHENQEDENKTILATALQNAQSHLQLGVACMSSRNLSGARENLRLVSDCVNILPIIGPLHRDTAVKLAVVVFQAGQHLNTLMDYHAASYSYDEVLALLRRFPIYDDSSLKVCCDALQSLVHTHIHRKDCHAAEAAIRTFMEMFPQSDLPRCLKSALGYVLKSLGETQAEETLFSSASENLTKALRLLNSIQDVPKVDIAKTLSVLGYCFVCIGEYQNAMFCLSEAHDIWTNTQWQFEDIDYVVSTLKHYIEAKFKGRNFEGDETFCTELLNLHSKITALRPGDTQVADILTQLGMVAFQKENETKACVYFDKSIRLWKQAAQTQECKEEIRNLLRYLGVASYNSGNYSKAVASYQECLSLLEEMPGHSTTRVAHIAECCAALGFTYSRLRDFDKMLSFYEKALEVHNHLGQEDLEIIETNIGSLYHVKAVDYEHRKDERMAQHFYDKAEVAFRRSVRYSWKSFPYINYGYYLLCKERHNEAIQILQQGYINGIIDKDTVEFDHTEDPILIEDLKKELTDREDIRIPSSIIALYLKTTAQANMGYIHDGRQTIHVLECEVKSCKYNVYYIEGYGEERMKALAFSLLGYAHIKLRQYNQALAVFKHALAILPTYNAAKDNITHCLQLCDHNHR